MANIKLVTSETRGRAWAEAVRAVRIFGPGVLALAFGVVLSAQVIVTLNPVASPAVGQPGVTSVSVIGSGFPSGAIPPANVTVTFEASAKGGGPSGSTPATAVQAILGSMERVTFAIPASISVSAPATYGVSIAGSTSNGVAFSSGNTASITINPAAQIAQVLPNSGNAGLSFPVAIAGLYMNFVQGATQASFGPGVSVGGSPAGQPGPVTVTGPATATAQLSISPGAAAGPQTVLVETGVQQASLPNGFTIGPLVVVISVDTTTTATMAAGLSGFNDPNLLNGVEYYDPKIISAVAPLKPGWIRFPAGTASLAFDWQAGHESLVWINELEHPPKIDSYTSMALTAAQKLTQAKGGAWFSDFATFAKSVGARAVVCFNGYTDTNPGSANKMVAAAQTAGLDVIEWELSNEPYVYPLIFQTPASYAAAMYNPYFTGMTAADPNATVGLFFEGQFPGFVSNYAAWDNGMWAYSPKYWNAVSVHAYPIMTSKISTAAEEATLNGVLAHGTTDYLNSYLLPLIGENTPLFITEMNSDAFGTLPFEAYLYNGIYLAEYVARMSTVPNIKAVGVASLYLGNGLDLGIIRAVNDFQAYLIRQVDANPNYSTDTATNPKTQFSFYYSAPALAMEIANQAINNSTHSWPTTVTGGPTVPILGYDGNPVPAVYAQGYPGDNGTSYLLITNKSGQAVPLGIEVNGSLLPGIVTLSYISNPSDTAQNTAAAQNNVQIVNTTAANPLTVGPYSLTRVEW